MDSATHPAFQIVQIVLDFLDKNIWPLIVLVIVVIARKGIGRFIQRMTKVSFAVGGASGGAEAVDHLIVAVPSRPETDQKSAPEISKSDPAEVNEKTDEAGHWTSQVYELLEKGDSTAAVQVFERQQRLEQDADQRFSNEALFLYLSYRLGKDASAFTRLEELRSRSVTDKQRYEAADWLASAYVMRHDYKQAEKVYCEALSQVQDPERKTFLVISLATAYKENGDASRGIQLLEGHLQTDLGNDLRASVFAAIANLEEYGGNKEAAAIAREMSVEFSAGDRDRLFQAAYLQSEENLALLSVSNYETLLALDPKHATALNNLGVIAHESKLSGKSIELYQRSTDAGSTLAMANLANKLIDSGFWTEAKAILDKARVMESVHENVGHALYRLQTSRNQEQEQWEVLSKNARSFQRRVRTYGRAVFDNRGASLEGTWHTATGQEIQVSESESGDLVASWSETVPEIGATAVYKCTVTGKRRNRAAIVTYKRKREGTQTSLLTMGLDKSTKCYSYLSPSSPGRETWEFFSAESESQIELSLWRPVQ